MNRLVATAFLFSTLIGAGAANAMPLALFAPADANVVEVAGGCGRGFHRGPYGGCRQNYADPGAHACPRGYHVGPYGGCRGDGR